MAIPEAPSVGVNLNSRLGRADNPPAGGAARRASAEVPQPGGEGRVMSIDALRGFDMFWIIGGQWLFTSLHEVFNNRTTGWIKTQLTHVEWEGFRFEDLIMPLFLFIVGVVMPFSFDRRFQRGDSIGKVYVHVLIRTAILFVLGMIAQGHLLEYDLGKLHIYSNTLQAIAAGYLISAVLILHFGRFGQITATIVLLLLFWALMALVPVPGYGAGDLSERGNLAIYIDNVVLGGSQDQTSYTWILSSMTFACTVMLGVMGGYILRSRRSGLGKVLWLAGAGAGCVILGAIWGGWMPGLKGMWGGWFPIIKHLWTSSFVVFSGGICYLLLAVFYLVIDVWEFRKWAYPFVVIGTNAIAVYMVTRFVDFRQFGAIFVGGLKGRCGTWYPLMHAAAGFAILWLILWWMYRKKSFIKI